MKIIVDYTEKQFTGYKSQEFSSREEAEAWVDSRKDTIYWSSIRVADSKSSKPKIEVSDKIPLTEFKKITGTLQTYFETGMECLGLIIYNSEIKGEPNPNFDQNKPESGSNFRFYSSHEGIHFISDGDILQVDGQPKFLLKKDRDFARDDAYRLSFYPQGFSREELINLFKSETVAANLWTKK